MISCDEHGQLKDSPMVGGAIGKHHFCPRDAAHAHELASGTYQLLIRLRINLDYLYRLKDNV